MSSLGLVEGKSDLVLIHGRASPIRRPPMKHLKSVKFPSAEGKGKRSASWRLFVSFRTR